MLETKGRVQIACREDKLSAIHSASVVEPATDLCFVQLKQTAPPKVANM